MLISAISVEGTAQTHGCLRYDYDMHSSVGISEQPWIELDTMVDSHELSELMLKMLLQSDRGLGGIFTGR
jgi:hypothetical protein